jgi:hypothetical protein
VIPLGAGPLLLLCVLALIVLADLVLAIVGRRP